MKISAVPSVLGVFHLGQDIQGFSGWLSNSVAHAQTSDCLTFEPCCFTLGRALFMLNVCLVG